MISTIAIIIIVASLRLGPRESSYYSMSHSILLLPFLYFFHAIWFIIFSQLGWFLNKLWFFLSNWTTTSTNSWTAMLSSSLPMFSTDIFESWSCDDEHKVLIYKKSNFYYGKGTSASILVFWWCLSGERLSCGCNLEGGGKLVLKREGQKRDNLVLFGMKEG